MPKKPQKPRRRPPKVFARKKPLPPKPLRKSPESPDGRCIALTRHCGNCDFKYPKGDRSANCPQCGKEHRCGNRAANSTPLCRYHGGAKGSAIIPTYKFHVAHQIADAYNRLIASPDLLNLSAEIAAVTARTDELFQMLDNVDTRAVADDVMGCLSSFEMLLLAGLQDREDPRSVKIKIDAEAMKRATTRLRQAIEPVNVERHVWGMIENNVELTRRLNETERKWLVSNEGMIPVVFVLEVLIRIQRITLKYIRAPADRTSFANEFRNEAAIDVMAREVGG